MAVERLAIRIIKPCDGRSVGAIIPQLDARRARHLIKFGYAELVAETEPETVPEPKAVKAKRKRRKKTDGTDDHAG